MTLEKNYHSFELELLAVVKTLQRFRHYLFGQHFTLITDCNAVRFTIEKQNINSRIARWVLALQEFSFDAIHRNGNQMGHVDALSRNPEGGNNDQKVESINIICEKDWLALAQSNNQQV